MSKITVIVPVHNTASYLPCCLESISRQSLRELEILCVNDASPDNALEILHEYAANDNRLTVIDLSRNQGLAGARNAAMAIAQGEFLGFVDSDDAIDMQFYEKLYDKAKETNATVVKGEMQRVAKNGLVSKMPLNDEIRQNKFTFSSQFASAIYNTRFIRENGIDFPLGALAQDLAFLYKSLSLAPVVETVDDVYYHYFQRESSGMTKLRGLSKIRDFLKTPEDIVMFLHSRHIDEKAYDTFYSLAIVLCCQGAARAIHSEAADIAKHCAETAIRLYSDCRRRDALDVILAERIPETHEFLSTCDAVKLAEQLLQNKIKIPRQAIASRLRSGLRRAQGGCAHPA